MSKFFFQNKILLITGGTGSFGKAVLDRFIKTDIAEIRIFSRDEKKQDDMRNSYKSSKIKFYIGDVRDIKSIEDAINGVDYVFHAAALKQVPSCEFHPMQAFKTNVIGTENVLEAAIKYSIKKVICLSTDKAVYPINVMGMSKAMMEKVMIAMSRNLNSENTIFCATRYGNVMGSRGSVIPLFIQQVLSGNPITITDPKMTRFMMSLEESVDLVLHAFKYANNGDIFVQKAPAATINTLARAITSLLNVPEHKINIIGARHCEKLYEVLLSKEEMNNVKVKENFFQLSSDSRDLNYSLYTFEGKKEITSKLHSEEYNSHNTKQLNVEELKKILLNLRFVNELLRKQKII
tara:strand:+ start:199 stop:1245 length:1047 start_codon:yes stop_codon:yes gene_type:complete